MIATARLTTLLHFFETIDHKYMAGGESLKSAEHLKPGTHAPWINYKRSLRMCFPKDAIGARTASQQRRAEPSIVPHVNLIQP
jgi:hypothetical protein